MPAFALGGRLEHTALFAGSEEEERATLSTSRNVVLYNLQRRPWQGGCLFLLATVAGVATWGCLSSTGGLQALGSRLSASNSSKSVFLRRAEDNCEAYFKGFQDCSKQKYWECNGDDGSWAYVCCCYRGFGEFSETKEEVTGIVSWSSHPELCLDMSTPYSLGEDYTSGPMLLHHCDWGDTNKQFHMPRLGTGKIRWASHPELCLGVKDGMNSNGELLHLEDCKSSPAWWTDFNINPGGKQISWAAHTDKCLRAADSKDGSLVVLGYCNGEDGNQHFDVVEPADPPTKYEYPRLFCLSLMLPFGSEVQLMKMQFARQIGIFGCHDYAIYSNVSISFKHEKRQVETDIMPGSLAVAFGGRWKTALNTDIFIRFWNKVVEDPRAWRNHWTAKLDPDAVFFPARLQQLTRSVWDQGDAKEPVFLNNCHLGMHGPIEVIARHALGIYQKRWKECKDGEPYEHKQEDFYFRRCWRMLGIKQVDLYNLLLENAFACDERASTRDGRHPCFSKQVSFHPFKSPESYFECYKRGAAMKWAAPFVPVTEIPSHANFHHG